MSEPPQPSGPPPPWWFLQHAERVEKSVEKLVTEQGNHARRLDDQEREAIEDRRRLATHLGAHGLGSTGEKAVSIWVAPTAMHAYHARWRILGAALVLLVVLAPALKPLADVLGKLVP